MSRCVTLDDFRETFQNMDNPERCWYCPLVEEIIGPYDEDGIHHFCSINGFSIEKHYRASTKPIACPFNDRESIDVEILYNKCN